MAGGRSGVGRLGGVAGLVRVVAGAVAGGVRWVVLREKDLPRAERLALATELRPILAEAGGTLIVAGPDPLLAAPDAFSVGWSPVALHLSAAGPYPPPAADLVGRSCHDEAELRRLTTEDYVTLSPVYPTRTKPGYGPPLRPEGLAELIRSSPVPALALGGLETPAQVRACVEAGATGVAVLGAVMRSDDPQETAAALTKAFQEAATPDPLTPHPTPDPRTAALDRTTGRSPTASTTSGRRPTVPTEGSSLTARSGHGRPPPQPATTPPRRPKP
ncbi:thiamine phosphate synthase [Micromonospora sp. WMMD1082]|uniref:thiamine phosphate synthase n=1 Tax=Micromonospora sp. WMMD1082 TaxID=3016104 RepID=UPI003241E927